MNVEIIISNVEIIILDVEIIISNVEIRISEGGGGGVYFNAFVVQVFRFQK